MVPVPVRAQVIYHLALSSDWVAAVRGGGAYEVSTIGASLGDVGFIHCSFDHQVQATAARYYAGADDVVVLTIDPQRLAAEVRVEPTSEGEQHPHVYGPLNVDAVVEVAPLAAWLAAHAG